MKDKPEEWLGQNRQCSVMVNPTGTHERRCRNVYPCWSEGQDKCGTHVIQAKRDADWRRMGANR